MTIHPENLKAMEEQYDAALKSPVTDRGVDWLCRALLLLRIGGVDAAKDVIHTDAGATAAAREYRALDDAERRDLLEEVGIHWGIAVSAAIEQLWHACGVLEIDPRSLNTDHVAITAATLLSGRPSPFEPESVDDAA